MGDKCKYELQLKREIHNKRYNITFTLSEDNYKRFHLEKTTIKSLSDDEAIIVGMPDEEDIEPILALAIMFASNMRTCFQLEKATKKVMGLFNPKLKYPVDIILTKIVREEVSRMKNLM